MIHKENGGVSSARNAGLDRVEGEFVNFMDPDDKLDFNTLSSVCRFFEEHGDEIDVVTIPMKYFEAKTGNYALNYIFRKGTRVIDLEKNWDQIQTSASSAFFMNHCFENLRFDTRLVSSEDAKLINIALLSKCKLGVISDVTYWYRRRSNGAPSAVQGQKQSRGWYIDVMNFYQRELIEYCLESY